jgi:putative oxidoreductase
MVTVGSGAWSFDSWFEQRSGAHLFGEWKAKLLQLEPYARSAMRIIVGFLIVEHGARKVFHVLPILAGRRNAPAIAVDGLPTFTGYIDLVVGALLIIGLFVRPAALIAAAEMLVAYFVVAAPRSPWPIRNGGGEALMHVVISVYIALMGAGILSLDEIIGSPKRARIEVGLKTG